MDKPGELGWWGRLNRNQHLVMTGSIVPLDGGRDESVRYSKTLYDKGHGNTDSCRRRPAVHQVLWCRATAAQAKPPR